jgi:DNA-binding IscR family transcriptional regulator
LARPAEEISLYDIMLAVEGAILAHSAKGTGQSSARVSEVWGQIEEDFSAMLKAISVDQLMSADRNAMWYI